MKKRIDPTNFDEPLPGTMEYEFRELGKAVAKLKEAFIDSLPKWIRRILEGNRGDLS